jgi:hypothetical protein
MATADRVTTGGAGKTLRSAWDSYRERVVPAVATTVQVLECKRAFYAGAVAFYDVASEIPDGDEAEAAGTAALGAELVAFLDDVKDGRA